jgi:fructose-specific phosphotransferase system IIA component
MATGVSAGGSNAVHGDGGERRSSLAEEHSCMKFADFITADAVRASLAAEAKPDVIREIVESLLEAGRIAKGEVEDIIRKILDREELGSTGIGRGIAVPHAKHAAVEQLIGTVAVSREGVDFDSLDGEKVHIVFLLISPKDRPGDHLRALENISRQLRNETFCRFLRQAKSAEDIRQLLEEADNNQFGS